MFERVPVIDMVSEFDVFVFRFGNFEEEFQCSFVIIDTGLMEFHFESGHSKDVLAVLRRLAVVGPLHFMEELNFLDFNVADKGLDDL